MQTRNPRHLISQIRDYVRLCANVDYTARRAHRIRRDFNNTFPEGVDPFELSDLEVRAYRAFRRDSQSNAEFRERSDMEVLSLVRAAIREHNK